VAKQYTDPEVAEMVRMLTRSDADHELVCTLACDRILSLVDVVAKFRAGLLHIDTMVVVRSSPYAIKDEIEKIMGE
jgi:hypothetical protein